MTVKILEIPGYGKIIGEVESENEEFITITFPGLLVLEKFSGDVNVETVEIKRPFSNIYKHWRNFLKRFVFKKSAILFQRDASEELVDEYGSVYIPSVMEVIKKTPIIPERINKLSVVGKTKTMIGVYNER